MKYIKLKTAILLTAVSMMLSLAACDAGTKDEKYTGGDTSIGGLFEDILNGERGDTVETTPVVTPAEEDSTIKDECAVANITDVYDFTGPWHLDACRNDLSGFSGIFEGYAEFGAQMEIRSDGHLSWCIGADGGSGTYEIAGSMLTAQLTQLSDGKPMMTQFDILRDGDEIYLGMHWSNGIVFWIWGDDGSANLSGGDTEIYPGENVVELVNLRGDETTVYKLSDGRYMDRTETVFTFNGIDTWTDPNGVEWNEIAH